MDRVIWKQGDPDAPTIGLPEMLHDAECCTVYEVTTLMPIGTCGRCGRKPQVIPGSLHPLRQMRTGG